MSALASDRLGAQVRLSPLSLDRLDSVLDIEAAAYEFPWSRGNFTDSLASGYAINLLCAGDTLLGYYVAMRGVDEVHLLNITVSPAYQRQGWAPMLLQALALWARSEGVQWLWLEVRKSNLRAQAVYETFGFRQVGIRPRYYPSSHGAHETAVVMSMAL